MRANSLDLQSSLDHKRETRCYKCSKGQKPGKKKEMEITRTVGDVTYVYHYEGEYDGSLMCLCAPGEECVHGYVHMEIDSENRWHVWASGSMHARAARAASRPSGGKISPRAERLEFSNQPDGTAANALVEGVEIARFDTGPECVENNPAAMTAQEMIDAMENPESRKETGIILDQDEGMKFLRWCLAQNPGKGEN